MRRNDDDTETLAVPLDPLTLARLLKLSRVTGDAPTALASALLHDILEDDDSAHGSATCH